MSEQRINVATPVTVDEEEEKGWRRKVYDFFQPGGGASEFANQFDAERSLQPGEEGYAATVFDPEDAATYRERLSEGFRGDLEDDISEMGRLSRTGGDATREARELQRRSAAQQMALARSQDGGGASTRRGSEAQSESYVQSIAPTMIVKEAEKQGFTREEAGAAGLLAMNDADFEKQIDQMLGQKARGLAQSKQGDAAGNLSTASSLISIGSTIFSDKDTKKNIRPVSDKATEEFLNALQAGKYDYRPEFGGAKNRVGPLLDDRVANTEIGQTIVDRDPVTQKLRMNTAAAPLVNMTLLKEQNDRLRALEKMARKPRGITETEAGRGTPERLAELQERHRALKAMKGGK